MGRMPSFEGLEVPHQRLIDLIQSQEKRLMWVRRDDHWDVWKRRMGSRKKYLFTSNLESADLENLKIYYLHLIDKELEDTNVRRKNA